MKLFRRFYINYLAGFELRSKYHRYLYLIFNLPIYLLFFPLVFLMRVISPIYLVRIQAIITDSIGHLLENTELYCCERDAGINKPQQKQYIDLFYFDKKPYCNKQLNKMWKRELLILPKIILKNIDQLNQLIPGGSKHSIGMNSQMDRDIHNLYEKYSPHITFNAEEQKRGKELLIQLGMKPDSKFVCIIVRDESYLKNHIPWFDGDYHRHRNSDIDDYQLAAKELVNRGYFVLRMGAKVNKKFDCNDERIIDYASSSFRDEFNDIFLGANCSFCISTHTGFDGIQQIFNKPIVFTNVVPLGFLPTWSSKSLVIFKDHIFKETNKKLSLNDIFKTDLVDCYKHSEYEEKGVYLRDNSPEQIKDIVVEMLERLKNSHLYKSEDELQLKFKKLYSTGVDNRERWGNPMHGKINISYSQKYLENDPNFLA